MKGKKRWIIITLVLVVIGSTYWLWEHGSFGNKVSGANAQAPVLPAVKAGSEVVANALVVPVEKAALSLPVGGIVAQVLVKEGEKVNLGQLLLRLESQNLQAALHQAEAALAKAHANSANTKSGARPQDLTIKQAALTQAKSDFSAAKADWERTQTLFNQDAASRQQLDQSRTVFQTAQARVEQVQAELNLTKAGARSQEIAAAAADVAVAKAALEQARSALVQTELRAPFAGTVASLDLKPGEYVNPGTPVLQLADFTNWQIQTDDLTELSVVKLAPDNLVEITFDAIPDLKLPGKVKRIKSFGQKKNGDVIYTVTVQPDRFDPRMQWNMTATVKIKPKI